jgi:cystathionine beta-lyase/cystathionine gamma-synthase
VSNLIILLLLKHCISNYLHYCFLLQRVLDLGVDVSIHSATKYLGGHSDILAGSVTSRSEPFLHGCAKVQKIITVPLNPMDSFLLARGIRTLDVRMQRHGENAIKVSFESGSLVGS